MSEIVEALKVIAERLGRHLASDPELRFQIRRLVSSILNEPESAADAKPSATGENAVVTLSTSSELPAAVSASVLPAFPAPSPSPAREIPRSNEPLPELTLGRAPLASTLQRPDYDRYNGQGANDDLGIVETRARLKANASRWAAERRRRIAAGAVVPVDILPRDRELISQAKELPNCFLWMCHQTAPEPLEISDYEIVGQTFDNLSRAISIVRRLREQEHADEGEMQRALDLLAESQSAVRSAITAIDGPHDTDQLAVFHWLRQIATEFRYYIRRHMKLDDMADRHAWQDLAERLETLDLRVEESSKKGRRRSKLLGKIRHKLGVIADEPDRASGEWASVAEAVDELVQDGMAPSNRDLRDLLLPIIDEIPDFDEAPWGFQLVLKAIDQHLANALPETVRANEPWPEVVQQAAALLQGKTIVLIGGDRRQAAEESLMEAFGLKQIHWIETREHQSIGGFEAYVARPEVSVVLLAIRWSSHSFGDVKAFCDNYNKPLVRLPGGYNPTQVATQILAQCSERLRTVG